MPPRQESSGKRGLQRQPGNYGPQSHDDEVDAHGVSQELGIDQHEDSKNERHERGSSRFSQHKTSHSFVIGSSKTVHWNKQRSRSGRNRESCNCWFGNIRKGNHHLGAGTNRNISCSIFCPCIKCFVSFRRERIRRRRTSIPTCITRERGSSRFSQHKTSHSFVIGSSKTVHWNKQRSRSGRNRESGNCWFGNIRQGQPPPGHGGRYREGGDPLQRPTLEVLDVPVQGRPANFSGNVGRFTMEAQAQPTSVKVGDPITLTVKLAGPSYLDGVKPPRLDLQETIAKDFKVPEESSNGKAEGGKMVFVQTLRAKTPDVKRSPPSNSPISTRGTGAYKVARTPAIPIRVEATRMVTAWDAEGTPARAPKRRSSRASRGVSRPTTRIATPLSTQAFGPTGLLMGAAGGVLALLPPIDSSCPRLHKSPAPARGRSPLLQGPRCGASACRR